METIASRASYWECVVLCVASRRKKPSWCCRFGHHVHERTKISTLCLAYTRLGPSRHMDSGRVTSGYNSEEICRWITFHTPPVLDHKTDHMQILAKLRIEDLRNRKCTARNLKCGGQWVSAALCVQVQHRTRVSRRWVSKAALWTGS